MKRFLIFLLGYCAVASVEAQLTQRIRVTHLSTAEGLGSANVRKTIQDAKGFIWVATQDGLYRFSGSHFTIYHTSSPKKHRLTGAIIRDILVVGNTLWSVNGFGGIDAIDIITGNIVYQFYQQQTSSFKDVLFESLAVTGDTLLIGSNKGLYLMTLHNRQLIPPKAGFLSGLHIYTLLTNPSITWALCPGQGTAVLDTKTLTVLAFAKDTSINYYAVEKADSRSVWVGSSQGILKYTFANNYISCDTHPLPGIQAAMNGDVFAIKQNGASLYFSNKNLLVKANVDGTGYSYLRENRFGLEKDWTGSVFGISFDAENHLWLSCQQGLGFSDNLPAVFTGFTKSSASQDVINHTYHLNPLNDSVLYASGTDGLYKVNLSNGFIKKMDAGKPYFLTCMDPQNRLWVSNDEGSFIWEYSRLVPLAHVYPEFVKAGKLVFNSRVALGDSVFILGTQNEKGIYIWNYRKHTLTNIHKGSTPFALPENVINTLYLDHNGLVWILCDNTVLLFDIARNSLQSLNLVNPINHKRYSIFFDVREINGRFFIACYGQGICLLDAQYRFVKEINVTDGLANNGVNKLLAYRDSLLFITTNRGLSELRISDLSIKNHFREEGMTSDEFEEFSGAVNGDILYAGGSGGFTQIRPEYLYQTNKTPAVYWNTVTTETASGSTDTSNLGFSRVIIPNSVLQTTVSFSALHFVNPGRTVYSYKIAELNKNWINIGQRDFINLIGLQPGKYTLQVRAANENGIWSEQPIAMTLVFQPKWYQTNLFRIGILLMVVGLLYAFFRYRINEIKKRQQIRKDIASDLHDDIGSTLNSVKVYMHMVRRDPGKEENLRNIEDSLTQATVGLRDMIWVLDDSQDTMQELMDRIKKFTAPLTVTLGIRFEGYLSPELYHQTITKKEKRNLLLIAKEAINNSIKYSGCTRLTIELTMPGGHLLMIITDDGNGFEVSAAEKGHGLTNIAYRARQIGYVSKVDSAPGKGTIVSIVGQMGKKRF